MAKDGREVRQVELHERTHRKDKGKGQFVDNKSKRVYEEYKKYEQENLSKHGSNPTPESSFDAKKWLEIVGGPSKGRVYSFGNTYHYCQLILSGTSSESVSTGATSTYVSQEQLQDVIARSTSILEEAEKARDEAKRVAEETKAREEAIRKMYEVMLQKFGTMEGASKSNGADLGDKTT